MRHGTFLRLGTAAALLAVAAAVPGRADAQFGGLIKKAKSKVAPSADAPKYDENTIELTPSRLDDVIKGLRAEDEILAGPGPNSVASLNKQSKAAEDRRTSLGQKYNTEWEAYQDLKSKAEQCRSSVMNAAQEKRNASMEQQVKTPEFQAKMMQISMQMSQAYARGDTAAYRKLREQMMAPALAGAKDDSAAADAKCGKVPAEPASMVESDSLDAQVKALDQQIQQREQQATMAAVRASGLTDLQFATARERILNFLDMVSTRERVGYSQTEASAIQARAAELRQLLSVS